MFKATCIGAASPKENVEPNKKSFQICVNCQIIVTTMIGVDTGSKILNFQDYNAQTIGIILLWLSAFLTLYTGYDYLRKGIDHAISEDNRD